MLAFLYGVGLQWRLDIRDKAILITYYIVPLVFFGFMGGIFTSIDPMSSKTLIQSMTVFGVTMGAFLGAPTPLAQLFNSDMKKVYIVGHIPLWTTIVNNFISGFIHLMIMSLIILVIAPITFDATVPNNLGVYIISLAIFVISSLLIGTLLGLYVKSIAKLTMFSQFVFLPSIMLSGIMFPIDMLPKPLLNVGKILPATWGYANICNINIQWEKLFPLFIIIAAAIVLCFMRIERLKKKE